MPLPKWWHLNLPRSHRPHLLRLLKLRPSVQKVHLVRRTMESKLLFMDNVVKRGGLGQRLVQVELARRRVLVIVSFHITDHLNTKVEIEYRG
jgi:hypothetical protein